MFAIGEVITDALVSSVLATPVSFADESETNTVQKKKAKECWEWKIN